MTKAKHLKSIASPLLVEYRKRTASGSAGRVNSNTNKTQHPEITTSAFTYCKPKKVYL